MKKVISLLALNVMAGLLEVAILQNTHPLVFSSTLANALLSSGVFHESNHRVWISQYFLSHW